MDLRSIVEHLASFQTRNSLSPLHREAAEWIATQYRELGLEVETMSYTLPVGKRVEEPTEAVQVLATIPGRSDRKIIVSAHFDTLNLTQDQRTGRAPGANDDASGIAVGLMTAMLLAKSSWENTIVFAALSGEEQGLCGAKALAQRAREERWIVDAVLNYDMVGNSENLRGSRDAEHLRLFSDDQSRELARWIEWRVRRESMGLALKMVLRHDRFGRGGDHTPFNQVGYRAVRFTEVHEEYSRQHTVHDLPEFVDFEYLRRVQLANVFAVTALAEAPPEPTEVNKVRANGYDTRITWEGADDATVLWRETTSATWEHALMTEGREALLEGISIDDHEFAVSSGGVPVVAEA